MRRATSACVALAAMNAAALVLGQVAPGQKPLTGPRPGAPAAQPPRMGPAPPPGYAPPQQGAAARPQPAGPAAQTASRIAGPSLVPRSAQSPFQLTTEQYAELMLVLKSWEDRSAKMQTLSCEFTRWEYNETFGPFHPQEPGKPKQSIPSISKGELKYASPDKGLYHVKETQKPQVGPNGVLVIDPATKKPKYEAKTEGVDHWICDGLAIYNYESEKKELVENRLPPELQGKAIADGPLPFLFSAQADRLVNRYFLRLITPPNVTTQIWIEAFPRYQADAANFRRATLILDQKTMLPYAIELYQPNGDRSVHQFDKNVVNDPFRIFKGDFSKPKLPSGWTKVDKTPQPVSPAPGTQPQSLQNGPPPRSAASPPPRG